jgi:hypothetical protein
MRARIPTLMALVALGSLLPSCSSIGVDNVVFVTRTNMAIDLDTSPPTVAIGYKRDELVLEPMDEQGRVLPVLTTVGTRAGAFEFGANHSFATGNAALVMARYLVSNRELGGAQHIDYGKLVENIGAGMPGNEIGAQGRQRIVFTTNTSLGLEVDWNAANTPDAISLGYKRKEFAFVPLAKDAKDSSKLHLASLLATAQSSSSAGSQTETGIQVGQTFATGFAATLMATHPSVRQALGPVLIPNWDEVAKTVALNKKSKSANIAFIGTVFDGLADRQSSDGEAAMIVKKLNALATPDLADDAYQYTWTASAKELRVTKITMSGGALAKNPFKRISRLWFTASTSLPEIDAALAFQRDKTSTTPPAPYTWKIVGVPFPGVENVPIDPVTTPAIDALTAERARLARAVEMTEGAYQSAPTVVEAIEYYVQLLTTPGK